MILWLLLTFDLILFIMREVDSCVTLGQFLQLCVGISDLTREDLSSIRYGIGSGGVGGGMTSSNRLGVFSMKYYCLH